MHAATLRFSYADAARASVVAASVAREAGDIEGDRTEATVDRDGATVTVRVSADDLVALRAGTNTWTSLVETAEAAAASAAD
ncbi:MAG: KEOPS complex subunit Pcc1 [Halobacteriaceae archaeon]